MIITVVLAVLVLAAVGYVLVSRVAGRPVNTRRLVVLPALLTGIGGLRLAGSLSGGQLLAMGLPQVACHHGNAVGDRFRGAAHVAGGTTRSPE